MVGFRRFAAIMVAGTTLFVTACASGVRSSDGTTAATGTSAVIEQEISDNLPEKDYGGYTFRMLIRNNDGYVKDMYAETETGDLMNDAIYKRNMKIGERFNITYKVTRSSNSNYETDAAASILAGSDDYDIVYPHARAAFVYAKQKLALNWLTDLPFVDLSRPWWAQDAMKSLSINNKLYAMTGDISYQNLGCTICMVFNKDLLTNYKIEYPYKKVLDGTWTFDAFSAIAKQAPLDLNGDSKIDVNSDQMGYVTTWWGGPIEVLYTGGQRIVSKDASDMPYLSLNNERTIKIYEKFFSLMSGDGMYIALADSAPETTEAFKAGRAFFLQAGFGSLESLRDMEVDFGIIPWPKFDESLDAYYTNVDASCSLIVVPITASDPERTGVILEALGCEGYKSVVPVYYDVALTTKYSRDSESEQMLDIIKAGRVYDLGYYSSAVGKLSSTGYELSRAASKDFASFYAANESAALTSLQQLVDAYVN